MRRRMVGVMAMVIALAIASPGAAEPTREDQQRVDEDLAIAEATLETATAEARAAALELAEVEERLPAAEDRVNTARGAAAAAKVIATAAQREADAAQAAYEEAEAEYDAAEAAVADARGVLSGIVADTYRGSGLIAMNGVLAAESPMVAMEKLTYVDMLAQAQQDAVDDVVMERVEARNAENAAQTTSRAAAAAEAEAQAALAAAEAEQAAAEAAMAEVADLIDTRESALATAETERAESLQRYENLQAESDRIAAELRAMAASSSSEGSSGGGSSGGGSSGGGSNSGGSGRLEMPVSGWKSSDFGMRYDPYFQVEQFHAGVDIAAGGGAPIYAAESGTVVRAGWNGGYGNFTCVYHGGDLSTCYAHQSSINVWSGQTVQRGQLIGRVGTTGASTGNHLHFEVRKSGSPVQPLDWLPSCLCR